MSAASHAAILRERLADGEDRAAYYERSIARIEALCALPVHSEAALRKLRFELDCRREQLADLRLEIASREAVLANIERAHERADTHAEAA